MEIDLEGLKAKAAAATCGPWQSCVDEGEGMLFVYDIMQRQGGMVGSAMSYPVFIGQKMSPADAAFSAAANPAVITSLVDRIKHLQAVADMASEQLARVTADRNKLIDERNAAMVRAVRAESPLRPQVDLIRRAPEPPMPNDELDDVLPLLRGAAKSGALGIFQALPGNLPKSLDLDGGND